jgi:uncharacterized protein YraI
MPKRPEMRLRALAPVLASACLASGLALAPSGASAQTAAYTSEPVDLYAGPSGDYPVVAQLGPGQPVTVMGCVGDYSWCDITVPGLRGWVYAGYLSYPYQGAYVPLESYGAAIGLPIVTFSLGAYWGSFYRDRPWYGDQARWAHVPPPERGRPPTQPQWHGAPGRPPGKPPVGGERMPGPYAAPPGTGRPPGNAEGPRPQGNMPPPGAGRPPVSTEGPRPQGNMPPPGAERPPVNTEGQRPQGNMPPPGAGRPPANLPPPNAPRPQEAGRPPAPAQQGGGRPPAGAPAQGYAHPPSAQPPGGMHPSGPAPEQARAPAPQGGHAPSQGSGRGDEREH